MAESTPSIFNKQATERLRSPDDLDRYVRVTNPSVWVVLLAIIALLAGILAWGVFGAVSTRVSAMGAYVDGRAICLLSPEDASKVHEGDRALVNGQQGVVGAVTLTPLSADEAFDILQSDYLVDTLMKEDWGYLVMFDGVDVLPLAVPVPVEITTERVPPISLVLG